MLRLLLYSLVLISTTTYAQSTSSKANEKTQKFVAEVSRLIKKNSIYSDSLDWNQIAKEIGAMQWSEHDSTNSDMTLRFFIDKLRQVGDRHSHFVTKSISDYFENLLPVVQPNARYLENDVGLIKVPTCMALGKAKGEDFANTIRREIQRIDTSHKITGWIVDLRQNTGGNMWPMLAGLNALIDDGTVGYFVSPASKKRHPWISKNGRMNFPMRKIDNYKIKDRQVKIAVLIDSMTVSSGEMTAISFIGLPHVKVFGQPSAGLTTANNTYNLSDGTQLNLATTYVADRTRKPYRDKIIPDVIVSGNATSGLDATMETSKNWLLEEDTK